MREHTAHLLTECNSGCKMAINSIKQILEYAKDEKLNHIILEYLEKHEKLENKTASLLDDLGEPEKAPGKMASTFSWLTTEIKMMLHDEKSELAKILTNGCNMGIQSIARYINEYEQASIESHQIAKELIKIEEDFMKDLQEFL